MTPAARLVSDAGRLNVRLMPEGDKLRVIVPEAVSDYDRQALRLGLSEFKAEVLALLAASPPIHASSRQA